MAMLDSLLDDFPLQPSLRIPPILDPFPDFAAKSDLPSPLEPNAHLNADLDIETAKLTGRRKALAEAKPIGEPAELSDLRPIQRGPRKRQKLQEYERIADFVQLPEPNTAAKKEKPRPFQPVSVLNELHEPPPSAALFPPITPNETVLENTRLPTQCFIQTSPYEDETSSKSRRMRKGDTHTQKRTSQRPRTRWTALETEQLQKGVEIYGVGKWKKILNHPEFSFQPGRTAVDLKDQSVLLLFPSFPNRSRSRYSHRTRLKAQSSRKMLDQESARLSEANAQELPSTAQATANINPLDWIGFTIEDSPIISNPRKGSWTDAEDEALQRGYRKYGFSWTRIAKDPELHLSHRTGPQVRDRFRTKFPVLYGEDPPRSHKCSVKEPKEKSTSTTRQHRNGSPPKEGAAGDIQSKPIEVSDSTRKPEIERNSSDINSSESAITLDTHPSISPSRPSASASSAYNILGLLNSDVEDDRPSSGLPLDTWDSNVTLPPLLWEEMATRPMFDLE